MTVLLGAILLVIIMTLCLLGLLNRLYDDNLAHCVGLVMVGLWALAQFLRVARAGTMPNDDVWLCFGLVCFGTGTAVRTWLYRRRGET